MILAALGCSGVNLLLNSCSAFRQKLVSVVPKGAHHTSWLTVRAGTQQAGTDFGLHIDWESQANETDVEAQIRIVKSLIARRVSAIVLAPIDKQALVAPVRQAMQNNIPVVILDSTLESDDFLSFVGTDNAGAGRLAGRRMGTILGGTGKVAIISSMPGSGAISERERAFQDEVRLLFPGIRVLGPQYTMYDAGRAQEAAQAVLAEHSDLSGIFADNESSSVGASRALKNIKGNNVKLVAFDSTPELVDALKSGTVDSLVLQDLFGMGYESVRAVAMKLAGKTPPLRTDTSAILVLADRLDSPEVRRLLFPKSPAAA